MSDISRIMPKPVPAANAVKGNRGEEGDKPGAQVIKEAGKPAIVYTPSEDQVIHGYDKHGHIYNKPKIEALKADAERSLQGLRDTVKALLEKQGLVYEDVLAKISEGKEVVVEIDEATRTEAQNAISEDGHWGVKKTAERIIDFAKTLAGDDTSKYESLVGAIKEGFEAARSAFGGELPAISQQTYDAVMKGLDAWAGKNTDPIAAEPIV